MQNMYKIIINNDSHEVKIELLSNKLDSAFYEKFEQYPKHNIVAPISGIISKIYVDLDNFVQKGDMLMIISANNTDHIITAETAGYITEMYVSTKDSILEGSVLLNIE